jgi:dienelactone hydrolase
MRRRVAPGTALLLAVLAGCAAARRGPEGAPGLRLVPADEAAMVDAPVRLWAEGLRPGAAAALELAWPDAPGGPMRSVAWFRADARGRIDPGVQAPDSGSYAGVDAMGLFWSMQYAGAPIAGAGAWRAPQPIHLEARLLADGGVTARRALVRHLLAPGVRAEEIRAPGVTARLYRPAAPGPVPVVLVLSGSEGGFDDLHAAALASHGFAALAVAYFRAPGLPEELFGIPVERVADAVRWVRERGDLDASRIALLGASKGAELALLAAARLPEIRATVAYAPTDAVQQGITRDGRSRPESSWSEGGVPLPFLPQRPGPAFEAQFRGPPPYALRGLYEASRADTAALARAAIPVERIAGALLLVSGGDDQMIPAYEAADAVIRRLRAHRPDADAGHLSFPDAGHAILLPYLPTPPRTAGGPWRTGGTPAGYARADREAWRATLLFLERTLR